MNANKRHAIFSRFQAANPHPVTELVYSTPFELLIAVMLSAQATDISVNKATATLFQQANQPNSMAALGENGLKKHIKSIGLFNTKAKNIIQTCQLLLKKHNGDVPQTRAELEALPGVGRKTANVVLNTAFGEPVLAVDTHIFRLSNRIALAKGRTVLEVERKLLKQIPTVFLQDAHHWLILHGRYICTARKPKCGECIIQNLCEYPQKSL